MCVKQHECVLDPHPAVSHPSQVAELRPSHPSQVAELCSQLQRQGQAKQLRLDNISASQLAMETLLSLTSQRAGAWFKVGHICVWC